MISLIPENMGDPAARTEFPEPGSACPGSIANIPPEDWNAVINLSMKYSEQILKYMFGEVGRSRRHSGASFLAPSVSSHGGSGASIFSQTDRAAKPCSRCSMCSSLSTNSALPPFPQPPSTPAPVPPNSFGEGIRLVNRAPTPQTAHKYYQVAMEPSPSSPGSKLSPSRTTFHSLKSSSASLVLVQKSKLACTFCNDDISFWEKDEWVRHEKSVHETGKVWKCPDLDCHQAYSCESEFTNHHETEHQCRNCTHGQHVARELPEKSVFACGFTRCKAIFSSFDKRCDHVAEHFDEGRTRADWNYSTVVRNLLRQPGIGMEWKRLLNERYHREEQWPKLTWHEENSKEVKDCLEYRCYEEPAILVRAALELGLSSNSASEWRLSNIHVNMANHPSLADAAVFSIPQQPQFSSTGFKEIPDQPFFDGASYAEVFDPSEEDRAPAAPATSQVLSAQVRQPQKEGTTQRQGSQRLRASRSFVDSRERSEETARKRDSFSTITSDETPPHSVYRTYYAQSPDPYMERNKAPQPSSSTKGFWKRLSMNRGRKSALPRYHVDASIAESIDEISDVFTPNVLRKPRRDGVNTPAVAAISADQFNFFPPDR
ncbi:hypothetical protein K402DRAFT_400625 [Aulographum hederae CBS 113979]|uniref:C2H2-type domain-containing protein n=1 Tax=Aulographum hederae CBS 113979 TaxID=1176131 RepID=A0A6G1HDM7_9PEZI|nr:hypothetical protein K402DRAFT_400625 [Aulographum hederae CBS 113979]